MTEAIAIDAVMRTLADPTRRAVFERIVRSDEITVVELTRGSSVTPVGHLPASPIIETGRPDRRAAGGPQRPLSRQARRARPAGRLDGPLWGVLARPVHQPQNPPEGDRSMTDAATDDRNPRHRDRRSVSPPARSRVEDADHRRADRPLAHDVPTGFEPTKGKPFTFQTTPAGEWDGVIRCKVLEATPNERLVFAWTGGHDANARYGSRLETVVTWTLTAVDRRHPASPGAFRLPRAEQRFCVEAPERRLAAGLPTGSKRSPANRKPRRRTTDTGSLAGAAGVDAAGTHRGDRRITCEHVTALHRFCGVTRILCATNKYIAK